MDEEKVLIILKGEDKTKEVEYYSGENNEKINIKFLNKEEAYSYKKSNVVILKEPEIIDLKDKDIYYNNQILFNVKKAIKFAQYIKIIFENEETELFRYYEISLKSNSSKNLNRDIIGYFRKIAKYVKDDDNEQTNDNKNIKESFLSKEYGKLNYIDNKSVLNYYINKITPIKPEIEQNNIIYPFRFNLSQKQAMENVYKSNISVIQGPPGTGKTQTILNIIANLAIMQNKTVAIVSNNNEAVKNVKDKLEKEGYDFIVADLGNQEKRKKFFEEIPKPSIENFEVQEEEKLLEKLDILNKKLNELLENNNTKAILEKEINEYKLEQKYFEEYYKNQNIDKIEKLSFYHKTDDRILEFLLDSQLLYDGKIRFEWLHKIKILFKYGIKELKRLDDKLVDVILQLQKEYYEKKIASLEKEFKKIIKKLEIHDFEKLQKEHQEISQKIFKSKLHKRYKGKNYEFSFENYQENMEEFVQAFPIILSTTYSLRNSIQNGFMFDYLIMDESSQIDLLAGSLALSCTKNAIIVGDEKQLPQIVDESIKEKISNYDVDICHDYFQNSMLKAITRTYENIIPEQTLKEHYRCHPKIIEFCNKRFYNNELIAFSTKEHLKIKKPLVLYYTAKGNHMRKIKKGTKTQTYNNRELEVITEEILKQRVLSDDRVNSYSNDEIGIVTPYRKQADNIQNATEKEIKSDTVHKFQGREKKLIIFSTVLDSSVRGKIGINFVDKACMVNVAVSRAINQFVIVTDNKLFNDNGNDIKALLKYIKYNELDSDIVESQIVSVFDLLYKDYSNKLEKLNNNLLHRSKYKSENIMDTILNNAFLSEDFKDFKYEREILIRNLFKNFENLNEEEMQYVNNGTRVDFVIYNNMDNKPILFIEVDGFSFHKNNPKQLKKDKLKDNISKKNGIDILRFETGEKSYDEEYIIREIKKKLNI
ncbi:MAG: AAA family ATPase [Clostridia bacterium]|nr:AAA family ATPase [Clostridia bacterium]